MNFSGRYGDKITAEFAERVGEAFAASVGAKPNISVAWDFRYSSPTLAAAVVRGLRKRANVTRLGICPASLLYFSVFHEFPFDAGIMITGGKAPSDHNGFKFCTRAGVLEASKLEELGAKMNAKLPATKTNGSVADLDILPLYHRHVYDRCKTVAAEKRKVLLAALSADDLESLADRVRIEGADLGIALDSVFKALRA